MYTYPRPQNLAYPARVLSDEGPLSRSDPSFDRARAGRTGAAPERSTAWWPVERWEALRLALGAHGALPCEVGTLIPPPGVPRKHPGASHRSIPSCGSRGTGKARTHGAARTRKLGCLKFESEICANGLLTSHRSF